MVVRFLKRLLYVLLSVVFAIIIFFIVASITDFDPPVSSTITTHENPPEICDTCNYSMLIWNIGHCGLGDDMDFFYEGGAQVRTSKERTMQNCERVNEFLEKQDTVPFILLQEVDINSKRSYRVDQQEKIRETLPHKQSYFAANYDVLFVPVPATRPYGAIHSGLLSLCDYKAKSAVRYSFPGGYAWPGKLFMPDRCFLVTRYALPGEKELVVVNTHNSAYDEGDLRGKEMEYLVSFLQAEYNRDNYVIVGGDWNQTPPSFEPDFPVRPFEDFNVLAVHDTLLPGWTWSYDASLPTNRSVQEVYQKDKTPTTVLDFYLSSPNIEIIQVKTYNMQFEASDHQPVFLTFRLRGNKMNNL